MAEHTAHHLGPVAVLHAGRCHRDAQQMPLGVGEDVRLAAFNLFACVAAAAAGAHRIGAFHTLAVDDRRTGLRVFLPAHVAARSAAG